MLLTTTSPANLAVLLAAAVAAIATPATTMTTDGIFDGGPYSHKLSPSTFASVVNSNSNNTVSLYFVNHYSHACSNSKHLAPSWRKLVDDLAPQWASNGIGFAQVDCYIDVKHWQLCMDHKISGYPSVISFLDGKRMNEYRGRNEYDDVKKFLEHEIAELKPKPKSKQATPAAPSTTTTSTTSPKQSTHAEVQQPNTSPVKVTDKSKSEKSTKVVHPHDVATDNQSLPVERTKEQAPQQSSHQWSYWGILLVLLSVSGIVYAARQWYLSRQKSSSTYSPLEHGDYSI
ncbi:hypothetical protein GQ42DRAFT_164025 [Ramicandelaber brevisporus]|nr:hypothetical protein GQ42DRAFT_164025 [Ramicandelaber brevisporus]